MVAVHGVILNDERLKVHCYESSPSNIQVSGSEKGLFGCVVCVDLCMLMNSQSVVSSWMGGGGVWGDDNAGAAAAAGGNDCGISSDIDCDLMCGRC